MSPLFRLDRGKEGDYCMFYFVTRLLMNFKMHHVCFY
jgi:hypothetical protein